VKISVILLNGLLFFNQRFSAIYIPQLANPCQLQDDFVSMSAYHLVCELTLAVVVMLLLMPYYLCFV